MISEGKTSFIPSKSIQDRYRDIFNGTFQYLYFNNMIVYGTGIIKSI
jgi:hypothetical protein